MEGIHGVDVGWLHHHASKDHRRQKSASNADSKTSSRTPSPPPQVLKPLQDRKIDTALQREGLVSQTPSIPITTVPPPKPQQNGGLLHRASSDKLPASNAASSPDDPKSSSRPTWMRNLSSKFTSQSQPQPQSSQSQSQPQNDTVPSQAVSARKAPQATQPNSVPLPSQPAIPSDAIDETEDSEPYVPQTPKSGNSFFSSALRRLSSGPGTSGKTALTGSTCARRVLNIDQERERCDIKGLDDSRLRRVAFSVDVEVAGVSRYIEESEPGDPSQKTREKRSQARSEGEALKNPRAVEEDKERASVLGGAVEAHRRHSRASVDDIFENEMIAAARRQEQDAAYQRRQDKEDKRRLKAQGETSPPPVLPAALPQTTNQQGNGEIAGLTDRNQDRPTTDPLRMYRRCCQLREAPVLKRISEQLATMKAEVEMTGCVPCLDLNGSRMQLPDVVCLGDWLAIVPVKKLLVDNANLSDEGLRLILAGLLAVKPPESSKRRRGKSSPTRRREQNARRPHGVVEKLSLRMNTKITIDGWRHICLFLNLSRSIKAIDLSLMPFPEITDTGSDANGKTSSTNMSDKSSYHIADLLFESLTQRPPSHRLEEFIVADCNLTVYDVMKITNAASRSGISRLGLAKNHLTLEALQHVKGYMQSGVCKGLDLGGNDLREGLQILASALSNQDTLWALSIADCKLDTPALATMLPALAKLSDFRFLDLSHNRELFGGQPGALEMLRKYLPRLRYLRRLHLADTSMSLEQAISIAEVLPEIRNINHISFLDNPDLRHLSTALDASSQEDACALYASLMVAVRISKTLLAVDIEVPSSSSNEVVQALAKQVVAYAFRNMDRYTSVDAINMQDPASIIPDTVEQGKEVQVPEVLAHLVGRGDGEFDQVSEGDFAPDQDYTVGGKGVVKALELVLGQKGSDFRRKTSYIPGANSSVQLNPSEAGRQKAKDMSKGLLSSARQIRTKIVAQLALAHETQADDELAYRRLQYLDATLEGMIRRFEDAYPDCALPSYSVYPFRMAADHANAPPTTQDTGPEPIDPTTSPPRSPTRSRASSTTTTTTTTGYSLPTTSSWFAPNHFTDQNPTLSHSNSRRGSAVNLAARAQAFEEGNMHRFGQHVRRNVLPPRGTDDHLHRTSIADPAEAPYLAALRTQLEGLGGEEIREQVVRKGLEATVREWEGVGERLKGDDSVPVSGVGRGDALATLEGRRETGA